MTCNPASCSSRSELAVPMDRDVFVHTPLREFGGSVRVLLTRDERSAILSVEETSIGIRADVLPQMSDEFSHADSGLIDGRVLAASDGPGRGARIATDEPVQRLVAEPAATTVRRRVLIVEDNRDAAQSLRMLLSLYGFDVTVAETGTDGLEQAQRLRPDAVVCDLGLPGISGYDVARAVRADPATAKTFLISVSGYGQERDRQQAREAGFDEVLVKPVDPRLLIQLLTR
jgi:CheY-like chemotaxis protein